MNERRLFLCLTFRVCVKAKGRKRFKRTELISPLYQAYNCCILQSNCDFVIRAYKNVAVKLIHMNHIYRVITVLRYFMYITYFDFNLLFIFIPSHV